MQQLWLCPLGDVRGLNVVVYKRGHADEVWAHFGATALLDALTADDDFDDFAAADANAKSRVSDEPLGFMTDEPSLRGVSGSTVSASVPLATFLEEALIPAGCTAPHRTALVHNQRVATACSMRHASASAPCACGSLHNARRCSCGCADGQACAE